ncbi:MAG: hypothetical protein U9R74_04715 [Pseudomonadota bacterium]|nr:hypothetical protein [Pseudomonadota bacterium]
MKRPLKRVLKDHLNARQLDAGQLDALRSLQPAGDDRPAEGERNRYGAWAGAAAVALLVAGLTLWLARPGGPENLIDEIASEVVENHLHLKPLEVNTTRIAGIQNYFTRLDFMPVESRYLADSGLTLLGGRYCSLQGVTAAQLRFGSVGEDDLRTLYEVGYDSRTFRRIPDYDKGEMPVSTWSRGIKVTLWVEKGVLFALTEEPDKQGNP